VRFYPGCTGLKTGSTARAGFCISATAERDGLSLICVIMAAESRDSRNAAATALLDWGFANYGLYQCDGQELGMIRVTCGEREYIKVAHGTFTCVLPKASVGSVEKSVELPDVLAAPVRAGEDAGHVAFTCQGQEVGRIAVQATETSERMGFWSLFRRMLGGFLLI
jgi:D-alanyl-D-alanine carboxypeptidase (penicillin-binding protein 5/6)